MHPIMYMDFSPRLASIGYKIHVESVDIFENLNVKISINARALLYRCGMCMLKLHTAFI
jgi:hypothetical protein